MHLSWKSKSTRSSVTRHVATSSARRWVLCLAIALATGGVPEAANTRTVHCDRSDAGMVVSDSEVASLIGRDMLARGGTAVDAAVATAFALAVSWPDAGNIGGGGFMIVRPGNGQDPVCIDYRETAPRSMSERSFSEEDTTYTQKAVGVPGTVRGLAKAHARFGKLPWKEVVMPSAQLASQGVPVTEPLAESLNGVLTREAVQSDDKYAELRRVYGKPDGHAWEKGDRLVLPDLARTLTEIAENGPDAFYSGKIADLLVEEMQRGDGQITLEDLRTYQAKLRPAMKGTYRGYTIIGAPPPSSGGTCIIEALNILEHFDLSGRDRYDPLNVHLMAEALRRAFADRARHLGDPDFVDIPDHLTSKAYATKLAGGIDLRFATKSETLAPEIELAEESPDTTHFSVVDGAGMAVSNTYTLEASWGSRIVVRNGGFVLNNEMGDFNWFPGQTNREGRIGTAANLVAPGKRMLSSQTPTIVEKDGRVVLVTGSPGGRTIISTVLCIIVNTLDFGMDLSDAVAAPRLHHQWFPDRLNLEAMFVMPHYRLNGPIRRKRHKVVDRAVQGSAHSIALDPKTGDWIGVSDYRRGGRPAAVGESTLGLWDFADLPNTQLTESRRIGNLAWSSDIAGSVTDGQGNLQIRRDSPMRPAEARLDLRHLGLTRVAVDVKIHSAAFAGRKPNEQLQLTFKHDTVIPRVTARLIFGRLGENRITLSGEAGPDSDGGTPIPPVVLSKRPLLDKPVIIRLELDTEADTYRIGSRDPSEIEFTFHATGKLSPQRDVNFFELNPVNDYASENEYLNIDRVELMTIGKNERDLQ